MTHPSALVSIVIPTYDRLPLLEVAIRSACAQTHGLLEIIVCDDAGPSDVPGLIETIGDPRVSYLRAPQNTRKAGIFAEGLRRAGGDYVMELNDDDALAPECVATLLEPLERDPDLVAAFGDHWIIDAAGAVGLDASDESSSRWGRAHLAAGRHEPFIDLALVTQAVCMNVCGIARRSRLAVDDFPPEVGFMSDYWLAYLVSRDGGAVWYCPERLAYYRSHDLSVTGTSFDEQRFAERSFVLEALVRDPRVASARPHLVRQLRTNEIAYAMRLVTEGRRREAQARVHRARATLGLRSPLLSVIALAGRVPVVGPFAVSRVRSATRRLRSS